MRLINAQTEKLEEFFGDRIPIHAILSHCWGEGEVSFQDINSPGWKRKSGYTKIKYAIDQTTKDGLLYLWVDTCCIDKSSSAELSEAINSMYEWYSGSWICYAFLEDMQSSNPALENYDFLIPQSSLCPVNSEDFESIKWFTRGWTLQELIAPTNIKFFGRGWQYIGSKVDLCQALSDFTKIPQEVLKSPRNLSSQSVAKRMSWASKRKTTRVEDIAYCLLGIFGINMPLLYGEGAKAFQRLQEELIKQSDDQTIFCWQSHGYHFGVFARSPADFNIYGDVMPLQGLNVIEHSPYTMTNKGLQIQLPLVKHSRSDMYTHIGILNCHYALDFSGRLGIPLIQTENSSVFSRTGGYGPKSYSDLDIATAEVRNIYIQRPKQHSPESTPSRHICHIQSNAIASHGYILTGATPSNYPFNQATKTMEIPIYENSKARVFVEYSNPGQSSLDNLAVGITIAGNGMGRVDKSTAYAEIWQKPKSIPLEDWSQPSQWHRSSATVGMGRLKTPLEHSILGKSNFYVEPLKDLLEIDGFKEPDGRFVSESSIQGSVAAKLRITVKVRQETALGQDISVIDITSRIFPQGNGLEALSIE